MIAGRPEVSPEAYIEHATRLGISAALECEFGYVAEDRQALLFAAANVVALPYTEIYQSGVCLTAANFSRAVVASAIGGLAAQVVHRQTGLLVPPSDAGQLAQALQSILSDPGAADAMGARAHQKAKKAGNVEDAVASLRAAYRSSVANHALRMRRNGPPRRP